MRACHVQPNRAEMALLALLQHSFPDDWAYTGNGSIILGGKCPDFVNINGKKALIELYGDWWHRGHSEADRAACFAPFGYQTLVVWEHELKDPGAVVQKIMSTFYVEKILAG